MSHGDSDIFGDSIDEVWQAVYKLQETTKVLTHGHERLLHRVKDTEECLSTLERKIRESLRP